MCGGVDWEPEGWRPFAHIVSDLVAAARDAGADEDAPLVRESLEVSVFPGVPLS